MLTKFKASIKYKECLDLRDRPESIDIRIFNETPQTEISALHAFFLTKKTEPARVRVFSALDVVEGKGT